MALTVAQDDRALGEPPERSDGLLVWHVGTGDGGRGGDVERTGEHRQGAEQSSIPPGQLGQAAIQGRGQRRVVGGAAAHGERQREDVVAEVCQELVGREAAQLGGRQLQRQRQAVESTADVLQQGKHRVVDVQLREGPPGAVGEQGHRIGQTPVTWAVHRKGREGKQRLTDQAQRLAAGGEDGQRAAARRQRRSAGGGCVDDVLAVVDDEEGRLVTQHFRQRHLQR